MRILEVDFLTDLLADLGVPEFSDKARSFADLKHYNIFLTADVKNILQSL